MELVVARSTLDGEIRIPGSKSHTIRAFVLASMASGESAIREALWSRDTQACVVGCRALGARIRKSGDVWRVQGVGGRPCAAENVVNLQNSGTSLRILTSLACLPKEATVFTGDASLKQRLMGSLLQALKALGAKPFSTQNNGLLPIVCQGPIRGGHAQVDGLTSQFLTSLLMALPLARTDSEISVQNLREKPYVSMTLAWLKKTGVSVVRRGWSRFEVPAGQIVHPFECAIPADFSSATFPLCAASIAAREVRIQGLDMEDVQGDKAVVAILQMMGAPISVESPSILVRRGDLRGAVLDLGDTPDALPALAVVGCLAEGKTRFTNVPQARVKECDRLNVMATELSKMGANVMEEPDGLVVEKARLRGARVSSHGDHRVAMALALAGLVADGETRISGAECIAVTYPDFVESMRRLGARMAWA